MKMRFCSSSCRSNASSTCRLCKQNTATRSKKAISRCVDAYRQSAVSHWQLSRADCLCHICSMRAVYMVLRSKMHVDQLVLAVGLIMDLPAVCPHAGGGARGISGSGRRGTCLLFAHMLVGWHWGSRDRGGGGPPKMLFMFWAQ